MKPILKTLNEMRAATTAEDAYDVGVRFLYSSDATTINSSLASTFAASLKPIFVGKHKNPILYELFLEKVNSDQSQASFDLRTYMGFALTDFKIMKEPQPIGRRLIDAFIVGIVKEEELARFKKSGGTVKSAFDYSAEADFPEIYNATDVTSLNHAINNYMTVKPDITDRKIPAFIRVLEVSFKETKISPSEQIEILYDIADRTANENLSKALNQRANRLIYITQGLPPSTADNCGRDFQHK